MTRRDWLRAEVIAAAIASPRGLGGRHLDPCSLVRVHASGCLDGDQQRGWSAGWRSRRSIVGGQPPDTVDGWAGWLAAHMTWDHGDYRGER